MGRKSIGGKERGEEASVSFLLFIFISGHVFCFPFSFKRGMPFPITSLLRLPFICNQQKEVLKYSIEIKWRQGKQSLIHRN